VDWTIGPVTHTRDALVNEVMAGLTGCDVGSSCPHGEGIGDSGAQKWMNRVIYELRKRGVCAGQHVAGSEELKRRKSALTVLGTDEIAVAVGVCEGPWEGGHIANFGGGKVVWYPGASRPSWTPVSGCGIQPSPTRPWSLSPPVRGRSRWEARVRGGCWTTLTGTLVGPDAAFCRVIGYTDGRRYCPPRAEGGTDIKECNEVTVGKMPNWPTWFWNGVIVPPDGLPEGVMHHENPYNLLVRPELRGTATVCGENGVCGEVVCDVLRLRRLCLKRRQVVLSSAAIVAGFTAFGLGRAVQPDPVPTSAVTAPRRSRHRGAYRTHAPPTSPRSTGRAAERRLSGAAPSLRCWPAQRWWDPLFGGPEWRMEAAECAARRWREEGF
jgi:hypothetical protein